MGSLRIVAVAGALAILFAASARAADMSDFPSMPLPMGGKSPPRIEEFISGWYLRGDLGYRFQNIGSAFNSGGADLTSNSINDTYVGSVGAGYKMKWFRFDATGDYGAFSSYTGNTGATTYNGKIDSFTVMLNGYVDLGTWYGLTPYVGAGVGGAYLAFSNYSTTPSLGATPETASKWNMAWAAMAGMSYNISHNLLIDVGYRHIFMGDAIGGPDNSRLTVKKLSGDEIRVGIRYLLD